MVRWRRIWFWLRTVAVVSLVATAIVFANLRQEFISNDYDQNETGYVLIGRTSVSGWPFQSMIIADRPVSPPQWYIDYPNFTLNIGVALSLLVIALWAVHWLFAHRLRMHLRTALLLVIVCGLLLWANTRNGQLDQTPLPFGPQAKYGWPIRAFYWHDATYYFWSRDDVFVDALVALGIIVLVWFVSEWLSRGNNQPAKANSFR